MKAVVFHGIGDIRLDDVSEPKIEQPTDAIVRITASAICGTDLHFVRGTVSGMKPGTILGQEAVGIEEAGADIRNLRKGDRVVVPSTIACGYCSNCRAGYHSQCDNANPHGSAAGTSFFGGPAETGPVNGLQAEFACVPFAASGLVKLPEAIDDDRAILHDVRTARCCAGTYPACPLPAYGSRFDDAVRMARAQVRRAGLASARVAHDARRGAAVGRASPL